MMKVKCPFCGEISEQEVMEGAITMCMKCHEHFTVTKECVVKEGEDLEKTQEMPSKDDGDSIGYEDACPFDDQCGEMPQGKCPATLYDRIRRCHLVGLVMFVLIALVGGSLLAVCCSEVSAVIWSGIWLSQAAEIVLSLMIQKEILK